MKNEEAVITAIKKSGLPDRAKSVGIMGAIMGIPADSIIRSMVSTIDHDNTIAADGQYLETPVGYTNTEEKIHRMLVENTGINMMDSGGDNNRAWQKNRAITDFREQPAISIKVTEYGLDMSRSVFHYLRDNVKYTSASSDMTREMTAYGDENDLSGLSLIEDWLESMGVPCDTFNTYNGESILSQVLQGAVFSVNGEHYIALQIHGGCDVRGGYTDPVIFETDDEFIPVSADASAECDCISVYTDDAGYHWYMDDTNNNQFPEQWIKDVTNNKVTCNECGTDVVFS